MNTIFSIFVRAAFTFVAFLLIQYAVPYYFLVIGGILGGIYSLTIGDDKQLGWGLVIGSVIFGVFALLFGKV